MQEQERALVQRCLRGDASAWEAMVCCYGSQIRRRVSRYVQAREEIEDLTQEVFLRVFVHLKSFDADSGRLSNWLNRVGRNLAIDHLRRNRHQRRDAGCEALEALEWKDERIHSPECSLARTESASFIRRALQMLAPELRQVIVLKYLEEMSCREIAQKLGVPDGTVKSRIHRGCSRLAKHLSGNCPKA